MLGGLTVLLVYQLIGEVLVRLLDVPVPGPVVGLALLFISLLIRRDAPPAAIQQAATGILKHLSLLFVPAGVGVMLHYQRLADEWLPILAALVISTVLTIALTALSMQWMLRRRARKPGTTP